LLPVLDKGKSADEVGKAIKAGMRTCVATEKFGAMSAVVLCHLRSFDGLEYS